MITSLADLLGELARAEAEKLSKSEIKHPTLIGGMYEGLTRELLLHSIRAVAWLAEPRPFQSDGEPASTARRTKTSLVQSTNARNLGTWARRSCDAATDILRVLGMIDPAELQNIHDDAFIAIAKQHGES